MPEMLYSRWERWSEKGIFARMMVGLSAEHGEKKTAMIDATYLKAHRRTTSMAAKKGGRGRLVGRTKGGMNTKLHAICDSLGRPLSLFVTAGQVSDDIGARALLSSVPNVDWLLGELPLERHWSERQRRRL